MPGYPYHGGGQWADGLPGAPAPAPPQPEQEMVFQWVDAPSYGRAVQQQQQYLQPPPPSPYFPMEPHHTVPHGSPSHLLDPHFAAAQGMDPNYPGARYGVPGQAGQRKDYHYGQVGGPMDGPYGHAASRGPPGGRAPGNARGARGGPGGDDGKGRGRQSQTKAVEGGSSRRSAEPSADQQLAAVLESMGKEGVRKMLVTILESLYEDRIKPMANYVKGRLKERSIAEPIVKSFVDLYAQHTDLFIVQQPTPGSQTDEAAIFMVKEPEWFKGWVDIDAPDDPYDEKIWEELAKFLDGEHTFAGGRYGMARELTQRKLPFLEPLSLGEICHMVQLAIQHRRLIVYHRKMLKPIHTVLCEPSPGDGEGGEAEEDIKDMDDLCTVLFRMLVRHPQGIRLCRMKQMIKHELSRKLSEMSFQCTKLIELFNQEPLSTPFVLDTETDGKSIYVRLGDPEKFSDHMKQLYAAASSTEGKQPAPSA